MDLKDLASRVGAERNWEGLANALRAEIGATSEAHEAARAHLALGVVLDERLGDKVAALREYEAAYRADVTCIEALGRARRIFALLGRQAQIVRMLELELAQAQLEPHVAAALYVALGDELADAGDLAAANEAWTHALDVHPTSEAARARIADRRDVDPETTAYDVFAQAASAEHGVAAEMFLRAGRLLAPIDQDGAGEALGRALALRPGDESAARLLERVGVRNRDPLSLADKHDAILASITDPRARAAAAEQFALRWLFRLNDTARGVAYLESALELDPTRETAFELLKRYYGDKGHWDRVVALADRALAANAGESSAFYLAQAGAVLRDRANEPERAQSYFARLGSSNGEHIDLGDSGVDELEEHTDGIDDVEEVTNGAHGVEVVELYSQAPSAMPPAMLRPEPDPAKLAALDEQAAKFEAQRRWSDVAKTWVQKAELLAGDSERVAAWEKVGAIHLERTNNVAEAIKAYEAIREIDPDHAGALEFLKSRYEQRRDWEKLLGLLRHEAGNARAGEQVEAWKRAARHATEKVKKPDVSIEAWEHVRALDPDDEEALAQLAPLYERAKDFPKLAVVLRQQAPSVTDSAARIALLVKLGTIAGDKLDDGAMAVEAWRGVLALDPNDRRAQEALKKRYLAMHAWGELEAFYGDAGKWDDLIRVLEREADAPTATPATKVQLYFALARLWLERKEKSDRAAKYYERVLELEPASRAAALALVPIYTASGDAKRLVAALEVKRQGDAAGAERTATSRTLGELYETKVKDPARAAERFREAFASGPDAHGAVEAMLRTARSAGTLGEAAQALGDVTRAPLDDALAVELRLHLAGLLANELGRPDEAVARYEQVLEIDGGNARALDALEALLRATGRDGELLGVLERRLALATEPDVRRSALLAIGAHAEGAMGDPARATAMYENVAREFGDDDATLARLDALHAGAGQWAALADVLTRRLALGPADAEAAALKFRLGQVTATHLGRPADALELYREILLVDPDHDDARAAVEALLDDADLRGDAARILEPIHEARTEWEPLVRALEILLGDEIETGARQQLLAKIADIAEHRLADPSRAFDAVARLVREDPDRTDTHATLDRLASATNGWERLAVLYRDVAKASSGNPARARTYWLGAGAIESSHLGRVREAAHAYEQVLARNPDDTVVLDALDNLYRGAGQWADSVAVARRRLALSDDPATRERLYAGIASLHESQLASPDAAIATWRELLVEDPSSNAALSALDALYERLGRWSDLADNLQLRFVLADDAETQAALLVRHADVRENRTGDVDAALELYRQALEIDPARPDALAALERLLPTMPHGSRAGVILEGAYRATSSFERLVPVYEAQLSRLTDTPARIALLQQIAAIEEQALDRESAAFDTLVRALALDPSDEDVLNGLERLARQLGAWERLVGAYETRLAGTLPDDTAISLHARAARIRETQLGDVAGAIAHHRTIRALDPGNALALDALEKLYAATGNWSELADVLEAKALGGDAREHLLRAAGIRETQLARPDDAVSLYERLLRLDGEDLEAIDALIRLHVAASRWDAVLPMYARKIDLVGDPAEKKRLHFEVASVHETERRDVPRAIASYDRILELDPDDLVALQRLDHLHTASGNWRELQSVLEREADLANDPAEVSGYRFRVADLAREKLGDTARAVDILSGILETIPDHAPSIAALEQIARGSDPAALAAAGVLEQTYTLAGRYSQLAGVLEVQLGHAADAQAQVELLHRIADLHEQALDDVPGAFDAYSRAVVADASDERSLAGAERLATTPDAWRTLLGVYDAAAARARGPLAVELTLRAADRSQLRANDPAGAIARFERVLASDPTNAVALERLDALYAGAGNHRALADVLRRRIDHGDVDPVTANELRARLATLFATELGDLESALASHRAVLEVDPEHEGTIAALEALFASNTRKPDVAAILRPVYESRGAYDRVVALEESLLADVTDPADRVARIESVAVLVEEQLGDLAGALGWYARALREAPRDEVALAESERLAAALGPDGWIELASTYADVVEAVEDPAVKQLLGKRLARIYAEELADTENAEAAYNYVLSVAPEDTDALEQLDAIYAAMGHAERLAAVLDRRVKLAQDGVQKVDLTFRLAQLHEGELAQPDQAVLRYRTIIEHLDPRHEESLDALERLYHQNEQWLPLYGVYERKLEIVSGDEARADVLARLATLASGVVRRPDDAVRLWTEVLTLRGEEPEALDAIASLHESAGRAVELVDVLERRLVVADDPALRTHIAMRIAQVHQVVLHDHERAADAYRRVLDLDPESRDALAALAEIQRQAGQWDDLVATLQSLVQLGGVEPAAMKSLWTEIATVQRDRLNQSYEATEAFRHVLAIDPTDETALDALLAIHASQEEWREVVGVLEAKADAAHIEELRIPLHLRIAQTWAEHLGDADGGRGAYEKILAIDPLHEQAFAALEQLHTDALRWSELGDLYVARHDALPENELHDRSQLLRRAAGVYADHLDDNDQAYAAALLAFEEDPSDAATLAALEKYAGAGNHWTDLLETVTDWWNAADGTRWTHLGLAVANWYGVELNHPERAAPIYQQVLAREPENLLALHAMTGLYRKQQKWDDLAELLERCTMLAREDHDRQRMHLELGEVREHHLNDTAGAVAQYRKALEIDPTASDALDALERVYETRGEVAPLVEVLRHRLTLLTETPDVIATHLRLADVLETRADEPAQAVEVHRAVLGIEPANMDALRSLERLYTRLQRPNELLGVLEIELEHAETERERIKLLARTGELFEQEFVRLNDAAARYEQIVEIDPSNDTALSGLERIYRKQGQWTQLIDTLDRHISGTHGKQERVPLFHAMGEVYADHLDDADRATDSFQNALDLDPGYAPTLEALAKIYEKQGDWVRHIETLETLASTLEDPNAAVEIRHRLGRVAEQQLQDEGRALELYASVLDLSPGHLPTLGALHALHVRRGEWDESAQILSRMVNVTPVARAKAKLLVELGRVLNERLEDPDRAVQAYEQAVGHDADNEDAAYPLVFHYVTTERWAEAEPLAEMLVRRAARRDPAEQLELQLVMGRVASHLGNADRAIKAFAAAHALDRANVEALRELSSAWYAKGDWENAFKHYHLVLVHHKDALDAEARADLYFHLGVIKREQNDRRRAINFLDKALEEVPNHRATLDALAETYAQSNDWAQSLAYRRAILEHHVTDEDDRVAALREIGTLAQEKAEDLPAAVAAFEEVLALRPSDRELQHKMLGLYQQAKDWPKVIDLVQQISQLEKDPAKKARYAYTIASIYNTELQSPAEAVQWYDAALDLAPSDLKPFAKINEILTNGREWKQLERAFRKMIHRVKGKGETELEFTLWHTLGLIYRDRLKVVPNAIAAFQQASQLKPAELTEQQILAELHTSQGETDQAVGYWMAIVKADVTNAPALAALYDLHVSQAQYDRAWCVAAAANFALRDRARSDLREFYEKYRPRRPLAPQARLDEERWIKDLFHPDEDPFVGKIFASIVPALRRVRVQPVAAFGLTEKERQDPATSSVALVRAIGFAAAALNSSIVPQVYLRGQTPGGLTHVASDPWASLSGATLLQGMSPQELQFIAAKHMSYYRSEHYIRVLFPTTAELTPLLLAAIRIIRSDFEVPPEVQPTVKTLGAQMAQDAVNLEGLRKVVRIFLEQGGQTNIKKWFQSVELTACRAGFLLSGDLDVARKMISLEPGMPGDVSPAEKVKDLVLFSISDRYFRLREALGLTIQAQSAG